eukprot:scaffold5363_cov400-Prasinococcus_capsulatus_cf.AAC.7
MQRAMQRASAPSRAYGKSGVHEGSGQEPVDQSPAGIGCVPLLAQALGPSLAPSPSRGQRAPLLRSKLGAHSFLVHTLRAMPTVRREASH